MRSITGILVALLLSVQSLQGAWDLDSGVRRGQNALYELDYETAEQIFTELAHKYPDDPTGQAFLSITYWNLLLRAAANLAIDDYATPTPFTKGKTYKPIGVESKRFAAANDKLISLCDRLLQEDPEHVKALYFKGVAHENLAAEAIAIAKSSERTSTHGRKAKGLHEEVLKLDPTFVDAKMSIAVYEFAKATLPWSIKWIAFLLGMRGNKEEALTKLQEVVEKGKYRALDAEVVMALLHSWKGDPNESIRRFDSLAERYPMNYLIDINKAAIFEIVLKDPKSSLDVYQQLAEDLDKKAPGLYPGEVYFRIGKTQYALRDYSMALESFEQALASESGERETGPLSSFYIAQIYDQRGDSERAIEYYQKVNEYQGPQNVLKKELKTAHDRLKKLQEK